MNLSNQTIHKSTDFSSIGEQCRKRNIKAEDTVSDMHWLLVFDSADLTENEEDLSYYDLRYYLPDSPEFADRDYHSG